jgi:hypothetical protein
MEDCRFKLSEVCSCGCAPHHAIGIGRTGPDTLKSLEQYRKQLEEELQRVNNRIKEIDRKRKG